MIYFAPSQRNLRSERMQQGLRTSGAGSKEHYVAADQIPFKDLCVIPGFLPVWSFGILARKFLGWFSWTCFFARQRIGLGMRMCCRRLTRSWIGGRFRRS